MNNPDKPPGSPEDFKMMNAAERAERAIKAQALADADRDFQIEQDRIAKQKAEAERKRRAFEAAQTAKPPSKLMHLLVAKTTVPYKPSKFQVVGMYSSNEKLAEHLIAAVTAYEAAGKTVGVVEFDLSLKVDQPAVEP